MQFDDMAGSALNDSKRRAAATDSAPASVFSPQVRPAEGAPGMNSDSSPPASTRTSAKPIRPSPLPSGF